MNKYTHKKSYHKRKNTINLNKYLLLIVGSGVITFLLIARLFQIQVLSHDYYVKLATRGQRGSLELPEERGKIIVKDRPTGEESLLATNTSLNTIYADPSIIKDPQYINKKIAPLLFNLKEEREKDTERILALKETINPVETSEEEIGKLLKPLTDDELKENFTKTLLEKISEKQRTSMILSEDEKPETIKKIQSLNLQGIEIKDGIIYAHPPQINDRKYVAETIAPLIQIPSKKLERLFKGENRYVILKKRINQKTSDKIKTFMKNDPENFRGLGIKEEKFRLYPEGKLSANIIGYVNRDNLGQYGIESSFNSQLKGTPGTFEGKQDSIGRQLTVGDSIIKPAINGDDIVLTIDRSIQLKTETVLEEAVKRYNADSGQIIIMNPKNGEILAMAHYPSFNPNQYGDVFEKVDAELTTEEINNLYQTKEKDVYYHYTNPVTLSKYTVFKVINKNGNAKYLRYKNFVGPEVYHNKIISWPYEPGSVFKTITMAIAIDDKDVTPNTTYNDKGPIGVDWNKYKEDYDYEIKNAEGYYGLVDMSTVLAKSLNTGMTFVAKKIGPALFYSYIKKFGFSERTDIELEEEATGKIKYYDTWTESELATHAFGQGLTVTMLQLTNAYSAIINGGILMQPHVVEEIRHDDKTITKTQPQEIRRVISQDTSSKMIAMLVNSTENGVAKNGQVKGHYVGGKTGTSQTYKHGKALSGSGTTITSFAGFGPVSDPRFVILVKLDYPKASEWGSATAAPTFSKIAEYLFNYYNIPPDKEEE